MEEERREYSVIGKVEIGTDEYRDLIEASIHLQNELSVVQSEKSKQYWELYEAKEKVKKLEATLKLYQEYVDEYHKDDFKRWKIMRIAEEEGECE